MQRSALCRSRQELSNAYLLAKIGVDTAENVPLEVWGKVIQYSFIFIRLLRHPGDIPEVTIALLPWMHRDMFCGGSCVGCVVLCLAQAQHAVSKAGLDLLQRLGPVRGLGSA